MAVVRGWGVAAVLLATLAWFSPTSAYAFPDEPLSLDEGSEAHTKRFQLLGELAMFFGSIEGGADARLLSPWFDLRLQLAKNWLLDAQWGFSYLNITLGDDGDVRDNAFRPGNPFVGIHYQGLKGQFSYRFGVGVAVPVARLPQDDVERLVASVAYSLAAAVRGNTSFWLWEAHAISVIFPLAFERRKPSGFLWGANFSTGVMIPCCGDEADRNSNGRNDPVVEMGAMMGYQAVKWLRVGSNFTLVILPRKGGDSGEGSQGNQKTQLAVEPFVRFGSENAFGSIGLMINLDRPWGFAFDREQVWGLRVAGGAAF